MGSGYVIEHCVSAFRKSEEEKAFRGYLSDAAMAISRNTSALTSEGQMLTIRFAEAMGWVHEDDRTGDEIAVDIIIRAGLKVTE